MGIPDHLTCLLRNLYAGQEATVRTGNGTRDWFQIRKGVRQGCILSPCLFNFYAEYIMRNAGLEEAQLESRLPGGNINNLRYADDTTLMAESEEELKSWKKHKLQSRLPGRGGNINNLRYADDTTLMAESEEELKSLLMKVKEESEKVGLKLTFRKRRSWHLVPSLHGK